MELSKQGDNVQYDDTKIMTAIVCLFIGFLFMWNVAASASGIYELHLDKETCNQVKALGVIPTDNCVITAPYRPLRVAPGGYMTLPDGSDIQITPVSETRTNQGAAWSTAMKLQFWAAVLFWVGTLGLLISAFKGKKESD